MMNRKIAGINILWYFIVQYLITGIVFVFFAGTFDSMDKARDAYLNTDAMFYLFAVVSMIGLIGLMILNFKYIKEKIIYGIENFRYSLIYGVSGYFIMMFFIIAFNLIRVIIGLPASDPENEQNVNNILSQVPLMSGILLVGLLVPLFEELVFRVSFMGVLTKDKKSKSFIPYIICAICFSLLHDQTIITQFSLEAIMNFMSYFILSLGLSLVYRFSNHNLVAVFIVHALNNTIATLLSSIV